MSDLTIFCLTDGEPTSNAFSVKIPSKKETVDRLKELIKAKKTVAFADVDTDKLTLWRVSVPVVATNIDNAVFLNEINSKTKLIPTDDVSKVFPKTPAKNTIHIIVQRPPLGISELDILSRVLPNVTYALSSDKVPSKATTVSPFRRTPTEVVEWGGFLGEMASYTPSSNRTFEERRFQFAERCRVSDEGTLCSALDSNVYRLLSWLTPGEGIGAAAAIKMIAQPDRIFYQDTGQLLMAIEVKTKWVLSSANLVRKYNDDVSVLAQHRSPTNSVHLPVQQIFGYLSSNNLRYGVLTTYEQTWFLKRDARRLQVSPAIHYNDHDPTLLKCYACVMELARTTPHSQAAPSSPSPPPPPDSLSSNDNDHEDSDYDPGDGKRSKHKPERDDGGSSKKRVNLEDSGSQNRGASSLAIEDVDLHEFKLQDLLGEGRSGRVFRTDWRGESVAIKICDLYQHPEYEEEMLTEMAAYKALEGLQGDSIPRFKTGGYYGGIFSIVTEVAGSPLEVDKLSQEERRKIVDKLSLIHMHGVLHNDIRPENILVHHDGNGIQVRFIDFAWSKRTSDQRELKKEIIKLKMLLDLLAGEPSPL